MAQVIKVIVDPMEALKKLNETNKRIVELGRLTVNDLAESGKWYARTIVPVRTGRTSSLIKVFRATQQNPRAKIVAQNPTASDGHKRNIANFNLVRWMHTSGNAPGHFRRGGDPHFMYTTREYLNNIKTGVAKGNWQRINIKI